MVSIHCLVKYPCYSLHQALIWTRLRKEFGKLGICYCNNIDHYIMYFTLQQGFSILQDQENVFPHIM